MPYTWEACVVKLADRIAYMGRDLEDSISVKVLDKKKVKEFTNVLNMGKNMNNSSVISTLISDLCENSTVEGGLKFSNEKIELLDKLNKFYIENVYNSEKLKSTNRYFKLVLEEIFMTLYNLYDGENTINKLKEKQNIYPRLIAGFIDWVMIYIKENNVAVNHKLYSFKEKREYAKSIIHYISGMTDKYAIDMYNEIISF